MKEKFKKSRQKLKEIALITEPRKFQKKDWNEAGHIPLSIFNLICLYMMNMY